MAEGVFINYRQADAAARAAQIYAALTKAIAEDVFLDTKDIAPGQVIAGEIQARLVSARVLLVVIGQHWLEPQADLGNQRLIDHENDWVRYEIRTALESDIPIVPIYVDDAEPLKSEWLPNDIRALIEDTGNAIAPSTGPRFVRLRHDSWDGDVGSFIARLCDTYGIRQRLGGEDRTLIEMTVRGDLDDFSSQQEVALLSAVKALLTVGDEIRIILKQSGSVRLTLEVSRKQAEEILALHQNGGLQPLGVSQVHEVSAEWHIFYYLHTAPLEQSLRAKVIDELYHLELDSLTRPLKDLLGLRKSLRQVIEEMGPQHEDEDRR